MTNNILESIYFINHNNGWTVGDGGVILNTSDGGENWLKQTSGTNYWLQSVHFVNQYTGWIVGNFGTMLKTTDGGVNWTSQLSDFYFDLYSIQFTDQTTGWVVGNPLFGIFSTSIILKTTNSGTNWTSQTSGTYNELLSVHFVNQNTGWVVGEKGTILKTTNGGVSFIEEETSASQPTRFLLSQNYPNPFNPSTTIKYQIPEVSFVTIKVYDVLGSEVAILVNEEKPVGSYAVEFNATTLPSGIYFYRLQAGSFVETKKMVLMK